MKISIDDLPMVSASRMRALDLIRAEEGTAAVWFGDVEFTVRLSLVRFPNGGSWSFFICQCGRRCRTLRLYEGGLGCKGCLVAKGLRYRVEEMRGGGERAAYVASRLRARLVSEAPARLKPHLRYSKLERRGRLEAALRRCEFVAARYDFRDLIGKGEEGG